MNIVIAPDSFKGSLSATLVADHIEKGIKAIDPSVDTIKFPMADGGEGTVETLIAAMGGKIYKSKVTGPLGESIEAFFGITAQQTAIIEMASASGLPLVPEQQRNPGLTTTYGTGQLIVQALDCGCRDFILGIGGSATNDGGMGMAKALGIQFKDKNGQPLPEGGIHLSELTEIDVSNLDPRIRESTFLIASDVDNPLVGKKGAAFIYGPQKGATSEQVIELDRGLQNFASVVKKCLDVDIAHIPGSGAAGGLGGGMIAFLSAQIKSGIQTVLEKSQLEQYIKKADLVITGEGKIDDQTGNGKTPLGIAQVAQKYQVPVIAIAGSIIPGYEIVHQNGISAVFSIINHPSSLEEAMKPQKCGYFIEKTIEEIIRVFQIKDFKKKMF
ncbi:MAG: glycerate kinase [Spirochaetes bacterium]|nr:glycerate kinase [Spirochaetota bacterium]